MKVYFVCIILIYFIACVESAKDKKDEKSVKKTELEPDEEECEKIR